MIEIWLQERKKLQMTLDTKILSGPREVRSSLTGSDLVDELSGSSFSRVFNSNDQPSIELGYVMLKSGDLPREILNNWKVMSWTTLW